MEYKRITSIEDPNFKKLHDLMGEIFPPEEVLEYDLWKEPLEDPGIRVFVAVNGEEVVGATEYRYYPDWNIAMTDFTIISKPGLSLGRFLAQNRLKDLQKLATENGKELFGMFAEIYDPYRVGHEFGGVKVMDTYVRREVLSHLGYKRIDLEYVHPFITVKLYIKEMNIYYIVDNPISLRYKRVFLFISGVIACTYLGTYINMEIRGIMCKICQLILYIFHILIVRGRSPQREAYPQV